MKRLSRAVIPARVRIAIKDAFAIPGLLAYKKKLAQRRLDVPKGEVAINYGGVLPRGHNAVVSGGKVKLIHLDRIFPERDGAFNILYLISSAPPPYAGQLVDWAKSHGAKLVWNQNGVAYKGWAGPHYDCYNKTMRALIHKADYVFYQSWFCRESANRFLGPIAAPWEIAYNYIDTEEFSPASAPPPPDTWKLVSAGSFQHPYRTFSAIETVARLKEMGRDAELVIAGRMAWPNGENETRAKIEELGLADAVRILPPFTRFEAPEIFRSAHLLLHTQYNDACPTTVLEAMACGLPVVGSASGAMPELVGDEGGKLADAPRSWDNSHPPDPGALADAVAAVMARWDDFSRNARARAKENFDKETWLGRHSEVFHKLILS